MKTRLFIAGVFAEWALAASAWAGSDAPPARIFHTPSREREISGPAGTGGAAIAPDIPVLALEDAPAAEAEAAPENPQGFLPFPTNVTAREIMESVVARFPKEPLVIEGDLTVRKRRGIEIQESPFRMIVNWGATPARASYVLPDRDGRPGEELAVTREAGCPPVVCYRIGGKAAPAPNLYEPVLNTDLSWMDLTFSFLWWEGGSVIGMDRLKGYRCYVLDIPAPADAVPAAVGASRLPAIGPSRPYARVRLWVEEKIRVMLQAEAYDARGESIRRIAVQSCKKINDRWMVKDMEIQGFPEVHRTLLSVRDVKAGEQP
ncbi:MAG: outer membrane lipoprotein-sorting protein [Verrucomicrobiota bacterium]|nr:outer membrane lipoprotein-sorting protein [Verrucomicrobiota bacterium]